MVKTNTVVGSVEKNSLAEKHGIKPGDTILQVNDNEILNILEYRYLCAESVVCLKIKKKTGEVITISIESNYEDLGITFSEELISIPQQCSNKCIFCFIDQLPKGMRETMYFKDDDAKLSFLQGNYVTLTNMTDFEIDRLIKFRISPINISVHTTNSELRCFMLHNKYAGKILEIMKKFYDFKIYMNCQIVLCPNINDGEELTHTLIDLSKLYPYVGSVSVVPVGLSAHREGLYQLTPFDYDSSCQAVEQVEKLQDEFLESLGSRLVYLSDEFYINAGRSIPKADDYEGFPQLENGVGIVASMDEEINWAIEKISDKKRNRTVSIITGEIAYNIILGWTKKIEEKAKGVKVRVFKIKNNFFGGGVSVAGLVSGCDIVAQVADASSCDEILIPDSMLRDGEDVFLDNMTLVELEEKLKNKITPVMNDGFDFVEKIIGETLEM